MPSQHKKEISNQDYIAGIIENDLFILKKIYKESLPEITKFVKKNSGTFDDAKDIFQEAIMVIYRKAKDNKIELTTKFHFYLFGVCKRIWLKKLSKKGNKTVTLDTVDSLISEENIEEELRKSRKWTLFNQKFQLLSEECKTVLNMLFNGVSGKEIAKKMGYTEEYAKRKK